MNNKVTKVSHIWSKESDRWIYLEYDDNAKIVGMNFMQGDNYMHFKQMWCENNEYLFEFYKEMLEQFHIEYSSVGRIEFINKCMWAFFKCSSLYDKYKN